MYVHDQLSPPYTLRFPFTITTGDILSRIHYEYDFLVCFIVKDKEKKYFSALLVHVRCVFVCKLYLVKCHDMTFLVNQHNINQM